MDGSGAFREDANVRPSSSLPFMPLLRKRMEHLAIGTLDITFSGGGFERFGNPASGAPHLHGAIVLHNWRALSRMLRSGAIGLGEGYMAGDWDSPDLGALLTMLAANMDRVERNSFVGRLTLQLDRLRHFLNRNSREGSRRNIAFHYDLGNDFYRLWLDRTFTYSAALYDRPGLTLEAAQTRKYARLAEAVGLKHGDHVLEIGCGWGGFAEYAAGTLGCRVTGITLSQEQLVHATARMKAAGLDHLVELRLQDYRDVGGSFDAIVSIEMLEAVGEEWWPTYFNQLKARLKPGGKAGVQVITIDDERFEGYRASTDFIQKYIFPGGMLPSDNIVRKQATAAGLAVDNHLAFGLGYAETLADWHRRFLAARADVMGLGYDVRFLRMWRFYLAYCEAGFRQGLIDVRQYVFT